MPRAPSPHRGEDEWPQDADAVFKALAHASRRQILLMLQLRGGDATAGEIAERLACRWPTTSRHLRVLEDAGLVAVEPQGRERVYHLVRERLGRVTGHWLRWFEVELPDEELEEDIAAPDLSKRTSQ